MPPPAPAAHRPPPPHHAHSTAAASEDPPAGPRAATLAPPNMAPDILLALPRRRDQQALSLALARSITVLYPAARSPTGPPNKLFQLHRGQMIMNGSHASRCRQAFFPAGRRLPHHHQLTRTTRRLRKYPLLQQGALRFSPERRTSKSRSTASARPPSRDNQPIYRVEMAGIFGGCKSSPASPLPTDRFPA